MAVPGCGGSGQLLGGRLLAGGETFFQRTARLAGDGCDAAGVGVVGMLDHAGGGVGSVADVAALDEDALAVADVINVQRDVLREG